MDQWTLADLAFLKHVYDFSSDERAEHQLPRGGPVTCAGEAFARDRLAFKGAARSVYSDVSAARSGGVLPTHLYVTCNDHGRQAWPLQHMPTNFIPLARV